MSLLKGYNAVTSYSSDEYEIKSYDLSCLTIKGELLTCSLALSDINFFNMSPEETKEHIKKSLVTKIVNSILSSEKPFVEFTKRQDVLTGTTYFMARLCIVPKDLTQIIRNSLGK